jgi:hypothetical protein
VFAFPGSIRVSFTNPAAILAEGAFHGLGRLIRTFATNHPYARFSHVDGSGQRFGWVCRPEIVARLASSSQLKLGRTSVPPWPQTRQVNCGSMSDSRTSSGHLSPLIAVEWPHL